ncbi:MAG: cyclodeaminase/cyclohydrolase family protein, partial [Flavobacteriales bacterium]|nr:cyclodeaminase/cyclohydrolase family protein [Flavobacteriales bacterium]
WDDKWEEYSEWAVKGQEYQSVLLKLVDEDTQAFNRIMEAYGLPKNSEEDKTARTEAIQNATKEAIEVPFKVMQTANDSMEVMKAMAESGLSASISDAGVGALCARSAVIGAYLNVKINTGELEDKDYVKDILAKADAVRASAEELEKDILRIVEVKLA